MNIFEKYFFKSIGTLIFILNLNKFNFLSICKNVVISYFPFFKFYFCFSYKSNKPINSANRIPIDRVKYPINWNPIYISYLIYFNSCMKYKITISSTLMLYSKVKVSETHVFYLRDKMLSYPRTIQNF